MSKEKFVRDKPHVNIGLMVVVFIAAAAVSYYIPGQVPPGNMFVLTPTSTIVLSSTDTLIQSLINGAFYMFSYTIIARLMASRKRTPTHTPEWTDHNAGDPGK